MADLQEGRPVCHSSVVWFSLPCPARAQLHTCGVTLLPDAAGASSGLGLNAANALAQSGDWHVIMACRDFAKGEKAAQRLGMPKGSYTVMHLDLASLESVRQFVQNFKNRLVAQGGSGHPSFCMPKCTVRLTMHVFLMIFLHDSHCAGLDCAFPAVPLLAAAAVWMPLWPMLLCTCPPPRSPPSLLMALSCLWGELASAALHAPAVTPIHSCSTSHACMHACMALQNAEISTPVLTILLAGFCLQHQPPGPLPAGEPAAGGFEGVAREQPSRRPALHHCWFHHWQHQHPGWKHPAQGARPSVCLCFSRTMQSATLQRSCNGCLTPALLFMTV